MQGGLNIATGRSNHISNPDGSCWPGERNPSQRDVEVANESLDAAFLCRFTSELVAKSATHQPPELSLSMPLHNMVGRSPARIELSQKIAV